MSKAKRTDKQRMDWLEKNVECTTSNEQYLFTPPSRMWSSYNSFREALDDAMDAKEGK